MGGEGATPVKNKSVPLNLSINQTKTPKENSSSAKKAAMFKPEERLNISVDIGVKGGPHVQKIDNNLRLSRISEEKLNISVDGISSRAQSLSNNDDD